MAAAAAAAAAPGSQHRCVFVGNIPYDATEEQLIQICEEVGPVVSFRLVVDRETGKPKGYGFCEYKDEETALSARRNLQGYEINGRQLRVDFAENDKRADRSREQGRGGPGLTSNTDAQKALPGAPPIPVDPSLHQPVGHQLAATAASVMARTLGGAQASNFPAIQNGLQHPSGLGNDPLTQYLAKMSRQQLNEIMSEMKALVAQNKPLAQQLFQRIPQLSKALFQAEIMLGMVPPQLMQMANTQQPSSSIPQPLLQNNMSNHNPLLPSQQREALVGPLTGPPNSMIPRHSTVPLQHVTPQPQFPPPPIPQGSIHGNPVVPVHPRPFGSFPNQLQLHPLPASQGLMSQVRPPLPPQHPIPGQHSQPPPPDNIQQSYLSHLPASQNGSSNHPVLPNGEQTGRTADMLEIKNHPSKRPKLEDGGGAIGSGPALSIGPGSGPGSQMANADAEKQVPQLPPELESALLQQVMNLTPEQISKLPPEQQQEVIQLQQMLANQNL